MGFRLLLANQDLLAGRIFKAAAPPLGVELLVLESLEEVTRKIRNEKFDAIFVDVETPGFSKRSFTRMVRKSRFNSRAPIFVLTGYPGAGPELPQDNDKVSFMARPSAAPGLVAFLRELKRKLGLERRKQRRLPFRTLVNCVVGVKRFRARSVDLSALGMQLEGQLHLERGEEFEAYFQLDQSEPAFRARARIVRIDAPKRFAVTFEGVSEIERQRIRRFLNSHLAAPE